MLSDIEQCNVFKEAHILLLEVTMYMTVWWWARRSFHWFIGCEADGRKMLGDSIGRCWLHQNLQCM